MLNNEIKASSHLAGLAPISEQTVDWNLKTFRNNLSSAIFGGIIALAVTWISAKTPHLQYTVSDPVQFQGEKVQIDIAYASVTNDGSKEAEDIECYVQYYGVKVQEVKVTPENLKPLISISENEFELKLALLNPGETFYISTLASKTGSFYKSPKVLVRAKGVKGEAAGRQTTTTVDPVKGATILIGTLTLAFAVMVFVLWKKGVFISDAKAAMMMLDYEKRRVKSESLHKMINAEIGQKLLIKSFGEIELGNKFSIRELAELLGEKETTISARIRFLWKVEKIFGLRFFLRHPGGIYSHNPEVYWEVQQIIRSNPSI